MGSEDLFHKRKARAVIELQRKKHFRHKFPRYLIVCEGTKTEPQYFADRLLDFRIPPNLVCIVKIDGSSPTE